MHTIDVEQFVSLDEIDPVSWDQTYYVAPDGAAGEKSYALFREALKRSGRVAIGRFVMRTKERVVCLRPFRTSSPCRPCSSPTRCATRASCRICRRRAATSAARGRELTLALQIIDSLSDKWDPAKYQDTFRERVMKLVEEKAKGGEIAVEPEPKAAAARSWICWPRSRRAWPRAKRRAHAPARPAGGASRELERRFGSPRSHANRAG